MDTPDPYVQLYIPSSPHGFRKTKVQRNTDNPIWNEVFYFYLDPGLPNVLRKFKIKTKVLIRIDHRASDIPVALWP